ncbi:MAG: hypothetical protein NTY83_02720, partial [Candidatus Micrarchaeota archaeon]|nr:hypothetical protein [Candidatus Micrarchaeota archaeon]
MQTVRGEPEELAHTTQELKEMAGQLLDRYLAYSRGGGEELPVPTGVSSALIMAAEAQISDTSGTSASERADPIVRYLLLVLEGKCTAMEYRLNPLDEMIPQAPQPVPTSVQQPAPTQAPRQAPPVQQPAAPREAAHAERPIGPSQERGVSERVMNDAMNAANAFTAMILGTEGWVESANEFQSLMRKYQGMQLVGRNGEIREAQQFLEIFMSGLSSAYRNVVGAYVNDSPSTRQDMGYEDLLDMGEKIRGILRDSARNATGLEERYGAGLVAAVTELGLEMNRFLFMETVSAALNPMMLVDAGFEPEGWFAHVFGEYGATETGSGGTLSFNAAFGRYIAILSGLRVTLDAQGNVVETPDAAERRAKTIRMLENSYHVDLSGLDGAGRNRIADRIGVFAGIMCDMAAYTSTGGTVSYDTFINNVENAGGAMREMFSALSSSQDSVQLLRGIEQVRAGLNGQSSIENFNGLRQEAYGRFADYVIDTQVLGTSFFGLEEGEAETPRGVMAAELGIANPAGMRGTEFLLSAYAAIANSRTGDQTFFQAREGIMSRLSGAGLAIREGEEIIANVDYGQQLFGSMELLGQYALVKNWDKITGEMLSETEVTALDNSAVLELLQARDPEAYAQYESGTLTEADALRRGRVLEGEIAGTLAAGMEERYVGELVNLSRRVSPGTAFFLFNNALPAIAGETENAEDFLNLASKMDMALTHLSANNSPYHLYGVQNVANSYLYVQVGKELRAGTGPSQEALDLMLRETNVYPGTVINFESAPNVGVE